MLARVAHHYMILLSFFRNTQPPRSCTVVLQVRDLPSVSVLRSYYQLSGVQAYINLSGQTCTILVNYLRKLFLTRHHSSRFIRLSQTRPLHLNVPLGLHCLSNSLKKIYKGASKMTTRPSTLQFPERTRDPVQTLAGVMPTLDTCPSRRLCM